MTHLSAWLIQGVRHANCKHDSPGASELRRRATVPLRVSSCDSLGCMPDEGQQRVRTQ